jgi:hypothetical protein
VIAIIGFLLMYGRPLTLLSRGWVPLAIGIAGVVVFNVARTTARLASKHIVYGPLPGDGTHIIVNKLVAVVGAAAAIGGNALWSRWADLYGRPKGLPPYFSLQAILVVLLVLVIHESGHSVAGLALKMKLTSFVIGPFEWSISEGKWRFLFRPGGLVSFLGRTIVVPMEVEGFRRRKILQVAAGPFISIVTGFTAAAAVLIAPDGPWRDQWVILSVFATISLLVGILNLVPFQIGPGYSDGAKLYQLGSGGLWSDYQLWLGIINASSVTSIRPREYDIATIQGQPDLSQGASTSCSCTSLPMHIFSIRVNY